MDDQDAPLTPEEERLKQYFEDEDSGKIPFVGIEDELPEYVPLPTEGDDVVAVIIPFKKQHGS
jgi:hypothetical protein